MTTSVAPFCGLDDLQAMARLVFAFPGSNLHIADLPYRLSSWAFDDPANACLWRDGDGSLLAWAVLQMPFWTLDFAFHPQAEAQLFPEVLSWAGERSVEIANTPAGHPAWYAMILEDQKDRLQRLEAAGFASQAEAGEDSWRRVFLKYAGTSPVAPAGLPDGYILRPLAGAAEVDAYVALHRTVFETRNMTVDWRIRTLLQPEYNPELDLVVVDHSGRLAAFCIAWLTPPLPGGRQGQIEPLGVHPDYRGLGLGQAVLGEAVRRLHAYGAQQVHVETDFYRDAALALYESAGFHPQQEILVLRKDVEM